MIKQIKSSEVKTYLEANPKTVLLDVRTENEWNSLGKPKIETYNSKTYFITVSPDLSNWQIPDPEFVKNVTKEINKENEVLVMCAAGGRSMIAAELLQNEGYIAHNISDGFSGNGQDLGWKNEGLPIL
jgi:rhodanese-related sulfurtransferase|tara:strand:- start:1889 stop:2272 length:384 start_codon:yes stop_codon:yes gene_type:complete